MIYLASPYTSNNPNARWKRAIQAGRYHKTVEVTAKLIKAGHIIFSPIIHGHPMSDTIGPHWQNWHAHNDAMMSLAEELWILTLLGWDKSKGVAYETEFAKNHNLPVKYLDPTTLRLASELP